MVEVPSWLAALSVVAHCIQFAAGAWMLRHLSLAEGELRALRVERKERHSATS